MIKTMKMKAASMTLGLCVGTLITLGFNIPTHAKSVGQASCGTITQGVLGTTPITKAVLESTPTGYIFRFTWKNNQNIWSLTPNLAITEAYTLDPKAPDGKGNWKVRGENIVKINPEGSFNISILTSSKNWCEFKGKLTFARGAKEQLFNSNSNSNKKRSALPKPSDRISTSHNSSEAPASNNNNGSSNCQNNDRIFVTAETENFSIAICGKSKPTYYLGTGKNNGSSIRLPLASIGTKKYTIKNGNVSYILTPQYLKIVENGKILQTDKVITSQW
jgi:hypothetical protein